MNDKKFIDYTSSLNQLNDPEVNTDEDIDDYKVVKCVFVLIFKVKNNYLIILKKFLVPF